MDFRILADQIWYFGILDSHDHERDLAHHRFYVLVQKRKQMRNAMVQFLQIRFLLSRDIQVAVIDAQRTALAEHRFCQAYGGRIAEVIGPRLEGETHDTHGAHANLLHAFQHALDVEVVAVLDRTEDRHFHLVRFGKEVESAQILRKARAAIGETWLEVVRRNIELRILAEQVHHLVAVDIELLADGTDLVTEGNLQRMVGVVDELDETNRGEGRFGSTGVAN